MRYVPYHQLSEEPNIIADGPATRQTKITLSHWPEAQLPEPLHADLSCQIVFNYLGQTDFQVESEVASNNHFDADGLVSLWALLNPEQSQQYRDLLIDIAGAGDFGTYKERDAARIAFVISAWSQPGLSPLNQSVFDRCAAEQTMILYEELLPRLPKILERVHYLEQYWRAQDDLLERSEAAIAAGAVTIVEYPHADLAIVTLPRPAESERKRTCATPIDQTIHPMAIHNRTAMMRILLVQGSRYELYYRYESWVRYTSRPIAPRRDLSPLAQTLTDFEKRDAQWRFQGLQAATPALKIAAGQESTITEAVFREIVVSYLVSEEGNG